MLYYIGMNVGNVRTIPFYGYDFKSYDLSLVADDLYVAVTSGRHTWPVSCSELSRLYAQRFFHSNIMCHAYESL